MTDAPKGPVLIDLDDVSDSPSPATADPVPDLGPPPPTGQAMQVAARLGARRVSPLWRWVWGAAVGLIGVIVSVAAWDFVMGLIARMPVLGYITTALIAVVSLGLLALAIRELAALGRMRRLDGVQHAARQALADEDLSAARGVLDRLDRLYSDREDLKWARQSLSERRGDVFDADAALTLAETELLAPLDAAATQEIEAAARQVATVTALVPLALADVLAALTANLRMIRRIAEIYGGRAGTIGSWRLTRTVFAHLVATGAVAVGDDLIEPIVGGGILSKLSRRFGEGLVNGALTARVGLAALEVCRPLPFGPSRKPSVTTIVRRALAGLFSSKS